MNKFEYTRVGDQALMSQQIGMNGRSPSDEEKLEQLIDALLNVEKHSCTAELRQSAALQLTYHQEALANMKLAKNLEYEQSVIDEARRLMKGDK